MKRRRTAVKRCEECDKSFESNEAGVRHLKSRSHTQKVLALKNALLMDEYEEIWEENDRVAKSVQTFSGQNFLRLQTFLKML